MWTNFWALLRNLLLWDRELEALSIFKREFPSAPVRDDAPHRATEVPMCDSVQNESLEAVQRIAQLRTAGGAGLFDTTTSRIVEQRFHGPDGCRERQGLDQYSVV